MLLCDDLKRVLLFTGDRFLLVVAKSMSIIVNGLLLVLLKAVQGRYIELTLNFFFHQL